ncbi:DUF1295 domain-containing protein [Saccharopolyspora sp. HNM0983]|uniref:DUF1295 domain-containing protein n=1 Tax=Saccharopolyspora montiporae TaxID=2781240 RepID=A0A929BA50_9PSEU|nr:DUF1295 domain-containing protein [Saccharopolyspora sp. HNM0983]
MPLVWTAVMSLVTALAVVCAAFGIAALRGRYDTIDIAWGSGFAAIAAVAATSAAALGRGPGLPGALLVVLTAAWGLRLGAHIAARGCGAGEDPRYRAMLARARRYPRWRMFLRTYLTQAAVMWFVSLPVQFGQFVPTGSRVLLVAGSAVWLLGMVFEVVGDEQLRRFRADPRNAGRVLDRGLWHYTRHPNYFGDACVWWGLFLVACQQPWVAAAVASPLLMTWLLARGSGKPLLERALRQNRPGYAEYVRRTSGFVPVPPKR